MTTAGDAMHIRIGTRSSELALRQARLVQGALSALGVTSELVTYTTVGDRILDRPLTAIGEKGLFTKELEDDLVSARTDCAVHSLKDLPTESPEGLVIAALLEREDPRDAVVLPDAVGEVHGAGLDVIPRGARVGSSSLRRRAQLAAARPDLRVVDLRGNVPTRIRKVDEGQVDAAILAAAGLRRLGLAHRISTVLEPPQWLPAPGQGAIAVQSRANDERVLAVLRRLDHATTTAAARSERALLAALEGGCHVPIGALAVRDAADGQFVLHGLVADLTGSRVVRGSMRHSAGDGERAGRALARTLLAEGGEQILAALRAADQETREMPLP